MASVKSRVATGILLAFIWFLLGFPLSAQEAGTGLAIILVLVFVPLPGNELFKDIRLSPKALFSAGILLFVLLWEIVKSNIDVALRVIHPIIPLNPGIVKVTTSLKTDLGRLALANCITLTPGTITVDIHSDTLYIHWIAIDTESVEESTRKIVSHFEKYLEVIFG